MFTEFLRDTPLLVQLFFLYYVLPEYGIVLPAFLTGALALGVQYSAYTSEVYRAGMESVAQGQTEAARALDLSPLRTFAIIIVPQAIPRIIPALGNYLVSIMKDVPVLSVVSVLEMLNVAKIIGDRTFNYMVPLSMVGGLYLVLTLLVVLRRRAPAQARNSPANDTKRSPSRYALNPPTECNADAAPSGPNGAPIIRYGAGRQALWRRHRARPPGLPGGQGRKSHHHRPVRARASRPCCAS